MRLHTMSTNMVKLVSALSKNEAIKRLLANNVSNPFNESLPAIDPKVIFNPDNPLSKIRPQPFNVGTVTEDGSFIRLYYNRGEFDESEAIVESAIVIDIIVAESLWLINDGKTSLVRPYEILGRIVDMLGKRSVGSPIKLTFNGWQHFAVNEKFGAIRVYCDYYSVEA